MVAHKHRQFLLTLQSRSEHHQCVKKGFFDIHRSGLSAKSWHGDIKVIFEDFAGLIISFAAEFVACAMGRLALDAIFPTFGCAVNDGGWLFVFHGQGQFLSCQNLRKIGSVRHKNHIPIMTVAEFNRIPLCVVPGDASFPTHMVGIDGGLIPVHVHDGVVKLAGSGCGEGFVDAPRRHTAFTFQQVDFGCCLAVGIQGTQCKSQSCRNADSACARGDAHKGRGGCRMPVQGFGLIFLVKRCLIRGIASETEQIFQTQLPLNFRQQFRTPDSNQLVAQGPHGVQAHGFMTRGVHEQIRILSIGIGEIVIHCVVNQSLHNPSGRNAATRMPGRGDKVVQNSA